MLPFILLNILVSAVTVIGVWTFLDRRQPASCTQCGGAEVALSPLDGITADAGATQPELTLLDEAATPTITPVAPAPTEPVGPQVHIVAAGEALGGIAVQYDVSIDEIVAENGLQDANSIFVGQQLVIPSDDVPIASDPAAVEEAAVEPLPTAEVVAGNSTFEISSVSGVGDISAEQILIVNTGAETAFLNGWTLSNDAGSTYTFSDIVLFGDGAGITVHSGIGENTPSDLFWGNSAPAWASGNVIVLRNAEGNLQAEFKVP